jgi:outer membrane lipoprotein-sorting protein
MMALAVGVLIPKFEGISDNLKEARILREETLEADGAEIDCYVIEAVYAFGPAAAEERPIRRTYWVDKSRFVVLREAYTSGTAGPGADTVPRITTTFTAVKINEPIADDVFVFVPPRGSKEVKDFEAREPANKQP